VDLMDVRPGSAGSFRAWKARCTSAMTGWRIPLRSVRWRRRSCAADRAREFVAVPVPVPVPEPLSALLGLAAV
jgi:hypothetical protein